MRNLLLLAVGAAALLSACLSACSEKARTDVAAAPAATPKPAYGSFGVDTAQMETSVQPGDDFYKYVNGKWLATTKIPADKSGYSSGAIVGDKTEADVHGLLDELAKTPQTDPTLKKVADLYGAWMDQASIEKRGGEPLKPYLDRVAAVKTKADLMKLIGDPDFAGPVGFYIGAAPTDTTKYAVFLTQSGLGMPTRDYYLNAGAKFDGYRAAYKAYVASILKLTGDPDPAKGADAIFGFEKKLAAVQWAPEQQRDVQKTNNPMNREGLKKLAPALDWPIVLGNACLGDVQNVVVNETTAIAGGGKLIDSEPVDVWKRYFAFHVASDNAANLSKAFDEAQFNFYAKTLRGVEQQRERWKRGVSVIDASIGEGLGQAYVQKFFPPANKEKMDALVANLRSALKNRIEKLDWMDEPTRAEALKKLATFEPRVGYPDKWRDYSSLTIEPGKLFEDVEAARKFDWQRQVKRLNQPVDRSEWAMTPYTVDAYYDPSLNQITFPAGILQPPLFDPAADPAVNYGAIGAVIGHEIGHGFDDQGREYDETGKIRNWWTPQTDKKFKAATEVLAAQYHAYCPIPSDPAACVNGRLTMGENIGDMGGLQMAYTAYRMSLDGKEAPVIEGFTGDQRFFMAYAQAWKAVLRDDAMRAQMLSNPHSPHPVRGSNPERNIDAWYDAFGVKQGDKMYLPPDMRVHIW